MWSYVGGEVGREVSVKMVGKRKSIALISFTKCAVKVSSVTTVSLLPSFFV